MEPRVFTMKAIGNACSLDRSHHFKTVRTALMALGLLVAGAGLIAPPVAAQDKVPGTKAPGKTVTEQAARIHGVVESLEGDVLSVTAKTDKGKGTQKLTLAADCAITLAPDKKGEAPVGQRDDIVPGIGVALTLAADNTTVTAVQVMGRNVHGMISAVDETSITVGQKTKDGPKDEQFTLTPDTVIILSHGKEKGSVITGTTADLKLGMVVAMTLSAVAKTTVREVSVQPEATKPKTPTKKPASKTGK